MKKIMISMLCLIFVTMLSITAFAAPSFKIDYANNTVNISGVVAVNEGEEASVTLHVLRPDKTYENCDPNSFENVAHAAQTETVNGSYSFDFTLVGSGIYHAYVGDEVQRYEPLAISFVNHDENIAAIGELNEAAKVSYDEFKKIMGEKMFELGFANLSLYDDVTQETVKKRLYDAAVKAPFDADDPNALVLLFETNTVMVALNENKVDDISEYESVMGIKEGEMKEWYSNPIVNTKVINGVTERISGKSIDDMDEFEDLFKEALILEIVENPNVAVNAMTIMKEYANDIGIDTNGVKDSVFLKLAGKDYADYAALRAAFKAAVGNGNGGSTGGGGGLGGFGGGGGGSVVNLPAEQEQTEPVPVQKGFDDIDGVEWAEEAILALADKNIVSYNTERLFRPNSMVSREEFVKLLVELLDLEYDGSAVEFEDVNEDDWFYPYVATAYKYGICKGVSDTEFGSGLSVKRQDIAVLVSRAMEKQGKTLKQLREPLKFVDSADMDDYAVESVNELCSAKILNGNDKGEFLPQNGATRAEAAVIIYGLTKYTE